MTRCIVAAVSLFAVLAVYAEPLDKNNSFTVEQDADTGMWRLECVVEFSPMDRQQWHTVNMGVLKYSVNGGTFIFQRSGIEISPDQKSVMDYAEGLYAFEIKKFGERFRVTLEANWPSIVDGEGFQCEINVSEGRPGAAHLVHGAKMLHTLAGVSP